MVEPNFKSSTVYWGDLHLRCIHNIAELFKTDYLQFTVKNKKIILLHKVLQVNWQIQSCYELFSSIKNQLARKVKDNLVSFNGHNRKLLS